MAKVYVLRHLVLILLLGLTLETRAQVALPSCWGAATGLNFQVQPNTKGSTVLPFLEIKTSRDEVVNVGEVHLNWENPETVISAKFKSTEPPFGNPINVYSLMLISRGQVIFFEDFTQECAGPGLSFYPGQEVDLARLKFTLKESYQIIIWARR